MEACLGVAGRYAVAVNLRAVAGGGEGGGDERRNSEQQGRQTHLRSRRRGVDDADEGDEELKRRQASGSASSSVPKLHCDRGKGATSCIIMVIPEAGASHLARIPRHRSRPRRPTTTATRRRTRRERLPAQRAAQYTPIPPVLVAA